MILSHIGRRYQQTVYIEIQTNREWRLREKINDIFETNEELIRCKTARDDSEIICSGKL